MVTPVPCPPQVARVQQQHLRPHPLSWLLALFEAASRLPLGSLTGFHRMLQSPGGSQRSPSPRAASPKALPPPTSPLAG